jgi:hypothetical protein
VTNDDNIHADVEDLSPVGSKGVIKLREYDMEENDRPEKLTK